MTTGSITNHTRKQYVATQKNRNEKSIHKNANLLHKYCSGDQRQPLGGKRGLYTGPSKCRGPVLMQVKKYVKGSVQKINCVQWWISQFLNIIFALHLDISPYKQV